MLIFFVPGMSLGLGDIKIILMHALMALTRAEDTLEKQL